MSYLSPNQLKQYEDEGFVSPINIFSKEEAKEIRDEIELIENQMPGELDKSGRYNAHLISLLPCCTASMAEPPRTSGPYSAALLPRSQRRLPI